MTIICNQGNQGEKGKCCLWPIFFPFVYCAESLLLDIILNCEHYRIIPRTRAQLLQLYRDSLPVVLRKPVILALYLGVYEYLLVLVPPDRGETERTMQLGFYY